MFPKDVSFFRPYNTAMSSETSRVVHEGAVCSVDYTVQ